MTKLDSDYEEWTHMVGQRCNAVYSLRRCSASTLAAKGLDNLEKSLLDLGLLVPLHLKSGSDGLVKPENISTELCRWGNNLESNFDNFRRVGARRFACLSRAETIKRLASVGHLLPAGMDVERLIQLEGIGWPTQAELIALGAVYGVNPEHLAGYPPG